MSGKKPRGRNLASDISLLADFYEKADKKRRLDTDRMWKRVEAGKDKLPCEHGRFMNDPRLRMRRVVCKRTGKTCVCVYYSELVRGPAFYDHFKDCPGLVIREKFLPQVRER